VLDRFAVIVVGVHGLLCGNGRLDSDHRIGGWRCGNGYREDRIPLVHAPDRVARAARLFCRSGCLRRAIQAGSLIGLGVCLVGNRPIRSHGPAIRPHRSRALEPRREARRCAVRIDGHHEQIAANPARRLRAGWRCNTSFTSRPGNAVDAPNAKPAQRTHIRSVPHRTDILPRLRLVGALRLLAAALPLLVAAQR